MKVYRLLPLPALPVMLWLLIAAAATAQAVSTPGATRPNLTCVSLQELPRQAAAGLLAGVTGVADPQLLPPVPLTCALPAQSIAVQQPRPRAHLAASGPLHLTRAAHTRRARSPQSNALQLPTYAPLGTQSSGLPDGGSMLGLAATFVLVLVLLFVTLRILRAIMPRLSGGAGIAPGRMVLHSESIAAKQTVQLLDLGVRLMVIGVSGSGTTLLTTIDDPAEMDVVRARYEKGRPLAGITAPRRATRAQTEQDADAATVAATQSTTEAQQSFIQVLAQATAQTTSRLGLSMRSATPKGAGPAQAHKQKAARPARTGATSRQGRAGAPSRAAQHAAPQAGDPALSRALATMRAIREQMQQQ